MDGKTIRKWNRIIHRDLGYLAVGLSLVYAISGFVVNHVHDWNPNYQIKHIESNVGSVEYKTENKDNIIKDILKKLSLPELYKTSFRRGPDILRIFVKNNTIDVNFSLKGIFFCKYLLTFQTL